MDAINDGKPEPGHQMAASKIDEGTDVNYGALTRKLAHYLEQNLMFH